MADAVLGGGAQSRARVSDVLGIRSREHGAVASSGSEGGQPVIQLGLAVVTAVAVVRAVSLALQLGGRDRVVADADRACDVAGAVEPAGRQRRRDGGDGEGTFSA